MHTATELRSLAVWALTAPASRDTLIRLADRLSALAQQEEERHAHLVMHAGQLPENVVDLRDVSFWVMPRRSGAGRA